MGVAFSADGKTLASARRDGTILLWNVERRQPHVTLRSYLVWSLAFSPDGRTLASGSGDNTITLWDVESGQPLGEPLSGHSDSVLSVTFSPDGKTLATGGGDGTIILWDVDIESWKARACRIANRNLTEEEWKQFLGDEPYRKTCQNLP